jgi:hypothetical protein
MEIDNLPSVVTSNQVRRQENFDDVSFVDDDDLQQALARARKMATKKVAKTNVEEIAKICAYLIVYNYNFNLYKIINLIYFNSDGN